MPTYDRYHIRIPKKVEVCGPINDYSEDGDSVFFREVDGTYDYHNNVWKDTRHSGFKTFEACKAACLEEIQTAHKRTIDFVKEMKDE